MNYKTLTYEKGQDGVLCLTLNRPGKLNAMNMTMFWEILRAFREMESDPEVKAVLITGMGDRAFSSGADFWGETGFDQILEENREKFEELGEEFKSRLGVEDKSGLFRLVLKLNERIYSFEKPTVAAVNGIALGVGWCFAQACDFIYASENAVMGYLFIRNAIGTTDLGTTYLLPRMLGLPRAKELMMLGENFSARKAWELGLVNQIFPAGELLEESKKLAARLAKGSVFALRQMKKIINQQIWKDLQQAFEMEIRAAMEAVGSNEFKEAIEARGLRREPFPGFIKK